MRNQLIGVVILLTLPCAGPRARAQTASDAPGSRYVEEIRVSIRGHYLRQEVPATGPGGARVVHLVRAKDLTVELDTSQFPDLKAYLDRGVLAPQTPVVVEGTLGHAPANSRRPESPGRLVCTVSRFTLVERPRVGGTGGEGPRVGISGVEGSRPAAGPVSQEDVQKSAEINRARGLIVAYRPEADPEQSLLKMVRGAGLRISAADLRSGRLFADLVGDKGVEPSLVAALRNAPATRWVSARVPNASVHLFPGEDPKQVIQP